jgi:hypothetical protein
VTKVYITIDTEYSAGFHANSKDICYRQNFLRSVRCATQTGDVGTEYQMDVLDRHGLKAVFFVDPMPALVWGVEAISEIVRPIVARGHDVQLHIHTEWLAFAGDANPVGDRTGRNIKDFSFDDQVTLLRYAADTLMAAGAPQPVAFRAGNYGANDDTLRALQEIGIAYDSSHCPGISGSECAISLSANDRTPVAHCGVTEIPIGSIAAMGGSMRHAQITALSAAEMTAAIRFTQKFGADRFTLVSHSFELLSRDRTRINHIVKRRFETLCAAIAAMSGVSAGTYSETPPSICGAQNVMPVLPHSLLRTGFRLGEQAVGNALYGAR